ncbi:MAG TPA: hypothetical protein DD490_20645 [Acidobacteria bacterium]|nr:hypothetical protein [Acidobacteriota bacterium]
MDPMFAKLGKALRELRESAGLSQAKLAHKAGVGKSQLSKYEAGRELPRLETLARVLRALDLEPLPLFYLAHLLQCRAEITPASLLLVTRTPPPGGDAALESFHKLFGHFLTTFEVLVKSQVEGPRSRSAERAKSAAATVAAALTAEATPPAGEGAA